MGRYDDIPESYKRQGRSVGLGATLDIYQHVLLSLEYSRILEEDDLVTASHSGRTFAALTYVFNTGSFAIGHCTLLGSNFEFCRGEVLGLLTSIRRKV